MEDKKATITYTVETEERNETATVLTKTTVTTEKEQAEIMYPMSMLHLFLTDEQIEKYGRCTDFSDREPSETHFHFSHETEFLETTNRAQTDWYNDGLPPVDCHVFFEDLSPEDQMKFAPEGWTPSAEK